MKEPFIFIGALTLILGLWLSGFVIGRGIAYPTQPFCIVQTKDGYIYTGNIEMYFEKGQSVCTVFTSRSQSRTFIK